MFVIKHLKLMTNLFKTALFIAAIFSFTLANAQTTHKDSSFGHKVGVTAKKVGHKTANIAANGAAMVSDRKYKGKRGPDGQDIYINKHSHYYYISKRGHRVYLKKSQLMDKPES
jgi:hypothetical protein